MVQNKRDFKFDLTQELKFHLKCKKKHIAGHFCTGKELADNLHMSLKHVLSKEHGLPRLVEEMIVSKKKVTINGRTKHQYSVIDPKMFTSEEIIDRKYSLLKAEMSRIGVYSDILSTKKGKPFKNAKRVKLPKNTKTSISVHVGSSTTAKTNEAGYANLMRFCGCANNILSISDSLNYAQALGTLEDTDKINKRIRDINNEVLDFVDKQIEKACSGNGPIVYEMSHQNIMSKVPAMFQYYNVRALSKLRVDSKNPNVRW